MSESKTPRTLGLYKNWLFDKAGTPYFATYRGDLMSIAYGIERLESDLAAAHARIAELEAERERLQDDRLTGRFIEELVEGYVFEGDDGSHYPTDGEQMMLLDCCQQLVSMLFDGDFKEFVDAALAAQEQS